MYRSHPLASLAFWVCENEFERQTGGFNIHLRKFSLPEIHLNLLQLVPKTSLFCDLLQIFLFFVFLPFWSSSLNTPSDPVSKRVLHLQSFQHILLLKFKMWHLKQVENWAEFTLNTSSELCSSSVQLVLLFTRLYTQHSQQFGIFLVWNSVIATLLSSLCKWENELHQTLYILHWLSVIKSYSESLCSGRHSSETDLGTSGRALVEDSGLT